MKLLQTLKTEKDLFVNDVKFLMNDSNSSDEKKVKVASVAAKAFAVLGAIKTVGLVIAGVVSVATGGLGLTAFFLATVLGVVSFDLYKIGSNLSKVNDLSSKAKRFIFNEENDIFNGTILAGPLHKAINKYKG